MLRHFNDGSFIGWQLVGLMVKEVSIVSSAFQRIEKYVTNGWESQSAGEENVVTMEAPC